MYPLLQAPFNPHQMVIDQVPGIRVQPLHIVWRKGSVPGPHDALPGGPRLGLLFAEADLGVNDGQSERGGEGAEVEAQQR